MTNWGATDTEIRQALPGDDRGPDPRIQSTRAITIQATAAETWSWLVQIGYKSAGWYSYGWLHHLLRCAGFVDDDQRSANRVIPALQDLQVEDRIHIAAPLGYEVVDMERRTLLGIKRRVEAG